MTTEIEEVLALLDAGPTVVHSWTSETYKKAAVAIRELQTELAAAKEKYRLLSAQHARLCDEVYEEDGETLKIVAVQAELVAERKALTETEQLYKSQAAEYKLCRERLMVRSKAATVAEAKLAQLKGGDCHEPDRPKNTDGTHDVTGERASDKHAPGLTPRTKAAISLCKSSADTSSFVALVICSTELETENAALRQQLDNAMRAQQHMCEEHRNHAPLADCPVCASIELGTFKLRLAETRSEISYAESRREKAEQDYDDLLRHSQANAAALAEAEADYKASCKTIAGLRAEIEEAAQDVVRVPREIFDGALRYIQHCGSNQVMRGEPHPQQWLVDGLLAAVPAEQKEEAQDVVRVPRELIEQFPELNPLNFNEDDVVALNDWGIRVWQACYPPAAAPTEPTDGGKEKK